MKRKRYPEEQIVRILGEIAGGKTFAVVCREYRVSVQTVHRWKSKYWGMGLAEVKRLRELEKENDGAAMEERKDWEMKERRDKEMEERKVNVVRWAIAIVKGVGRGITILVVLVLLAILVFYIYFGGKFPNLLH